MAILAIVNASDLVVNLFWILLAVLSSIIAFYLYRQAQ